MRTELKLRRERLDAALRRIDAAIHIAEQRSEGRAATNLSALRNDILVALRALQVRVTRLDESS